MADERQDSGTASEQFTVLGKHTSRKDGVARVTGQEQYSVDISLPHMLFGRAVGSPHAHARIKRIDVTRAREMGAVVITAEDVPHVCYNERILTIPSKLHKDHYVLADKVRRMGEAVAAVAAETEELAEQACRAVQVEYEVLPAITDPLEAIGPEAEPIHDSVIWGDQQIKISNNIACERSVDQGDAVGVLAASDVLVGGTFSTPKIYHLQLEPKTAVCRPEPGGGLTVWATTQSIHNVRILLGEIFNLPLSKIDVIRMPVGGTFGSSIQMNSPIPICAALALRAGRPVKLSLSREEDAHDHTRYGPQIMLKLGAQKDGTLTAADMDLIADIGAHNIQAYSFLGVCVGWMVSLYKFPHVRYRGRAVYTNKSPSCAMQGFGNPQVTFAVESLMDELAAKLDMDPIELRLKNYVGKGDSFWGQGPEVRTIVESDGVPELLHRGGEIIGWSSRPRPGEQTGRFWRGLGMARGFHTSSAGAPKPGDVIDLSGCMVKINIDGSVDVVTAVMDHGGGTLEAIAKLVAETLKVPLDKVEVPQTGTSTTVYDCATHATRGVYAGGGAAVRAALAVRRELLETAAVFLDVMPEALTIRLDETHGQGLVFAPTIPDRQLTIREIATRCWSESRKTIAALVSHRPTSCPPAYVSTFVEIEVDTQTGQVETRHAAMGIDCGTPVNPDQVVGQLEGGLSKGAGFALLEDNQWDSRGQVLSKGFMVDMKTLGMCETPKLEGLVSFFAHTYEPTGPFGAKGVGEAATNSVAAAYANALYNALGIRFYELPITPEKILAALRPQTETNREMTRERDDQFAPALPTI